MIKNFLFWLFFCAVVYAHYTMYVEAEEVNAEGVYEKFLIYKVY